MHTSSPERPSAPLRRADLGSRRAIANRIDTGCAYVQGIYVQYKRVCVCVYVCVITGQKPQAQEGARAPPPGCGPPPVCAAPAGRTA